MRARRGLAVAAATALLAAGLVGCSGTDEGTRAKAAAQKFLDAWASENYDAAGSATDSPEGPREWLPVVDEQLGGARVRFSLGDVSVDGASGKQSFTASWSLPGQARRWTYPNTLELVKDGKKDTWTVKWDVSVIHPDLAPTLRFSADRTLPERASILDGAGKPLFVKTPVSVIGLEPRKVPDIDALAATLVLELAPFAELTALDIVADARRAKPDAFVPVIAVRTAQYEKVAAGIEALTGVTVRPGERQLTPTATFGQPLLGRVGDITAEILEESGPAFSAGDVVGLSGLQRAFNKQLAGAPALKISLIDSDAKPVKQLAEFPGRAGEPLQTTIDRAVQSAAEKALEGVDELAAIVAVRPSTGEILAVANSESANFDIAMEGKYPPGSTFKVITATALLQSGAVRPQDPVACPGSLVVGGKRFVNQNQFDLGTVPLRTAFHRSCNTTFTSLSEKLPDGVLARTAAQFGFGATWKLPVAAFTGSIPPPTTPAGRAADAIGQGTVLASPFIMAMVAASVKQGSLPTPSLVARQPAGVKSPPAPLSPTAVGPLRDYTRAVVTDGTGKALSRFAELGGKTGTAEYGTETPPRSHSWFIGYQGDLAFAVFVHDGASTKTPATGVTSTFLRALR